MSDIKTKLTGWSATVGLVALGLLGHTTQSQAALPGANDTNAPDQARTLGAQVADDTTNSSPPPPPAVGGVRG